MSWQRFLEMIGIAEPETKTEPEAAVAETEAAAGTEPAGEPAAEAAAETEPEAAVAETEAAGEPEMAPAAVEEAAQEAAEEPAAEPEKEAEAAEEPAAEPEQEAEAAGESAEEPESEPAGEEGSDPGTAVLAYFEKIAAIPHGSGNTKALSDAIAKFAADHGYECVQDEADNVIITAPATPGYEQEPPISLQGHIDMVCASDPDRVIDMEKEAVTIVRDGEWMHAEGTTLGADNGIAVAMMLAILGDPSIPHPLLECIFTTGEEVGMCGAEKLDLTSLKSRRLLNLDSEEEGIICAGCAGGSVLQAHIPAKYKKKKGYLYEVEISDLTGGHSGMSIGDGGANAIVLMARMLDELYEMQPISLVRIEGGDADNAIPRRCCAAFLADKLFGEELFSSVLQFTEEYRNTDPNLSWKITEPGTEGDRTKTGAFGRGGSRRMLSFLINMPSGVFERIPGDPHKVRTSINAGVVKTGETGIFVTFMGRSSINAHLDMMNRRVISLAGLAGGEAEVMYRHTAWEYREESAFRDEVCEIYRELFGREAGITVIHAGLECGILAGKVPGLDCLSIGPDILDVHTTKERLNITSAGEVYKFVLAILAARGKGKGPSQR